MVAREQRKQRGRMLVGAIIGLAFLFLDAPRCMAQTVIYSTFGPGMTFDNGPGLAVCGASTPNCKPHSQSIACPFKPNETVLLDRIDIAVAIVSGTNSVSVELGESVMGGLPGGAVLASWTLTQLQATVVTNRLVAPPGVILFPGRTYWLVVGPAANDSDGFWANTSLGAASAYAYWYTRDRGMSWLRSDTLPEAGAFDIIGLPISTQQSWATMSTESRVNALLSAGIEAAGKQQWDDAYAAFKAADKISPESPVVLYDLAVTHERAGHNLSAIAWFHAHLGAAPALSNSNAVEREILILEATEQAKMSAGLRSIERAINHIPDPQWKQVSTDVCLAFTYVLLGDLDDALRDERSGPRSSNRGRDWLRAYDALVQANLSNLDGDTLRQALLVVNELETSAGERSPWLQGSIDNAELEIAKEFAARGDGQTASTASSKIVAADVRKKAESLLHGDKSAAKSLSVVEKWVHLAETIDAGGDLMPDKLLNQGYLNQRVRDWFPEDVRQYLQTLVDNVDIGSAVEFINEPGAHETVAVPEALSDAVSVEAIYLNAIKHLELLQLTENLAVRSQSISTSNTTAPTARETYRNPQELKPAQGENSEPSVQESNLTEAEKRAIALYSQEHYAEASPLFDEACTGGISEACLNLGSMYADGNGVAKDYSRAAALFSKACDSGNATGCGYLGAMYADGVGVAKDYSRAVGLYAKACDASFVNGCAALGSMYANGAGVPKDYSRALALFSKSCDAGAAIGCAYLGEMYLDGIGVTRDNPRAVALFSKACDAGAAMGCRALGYMYADGKGGLAKDRGRAAQLYKKACDLGDDEGCDQLKTRKELKRKPVYIPPGTVITEK